MDLDILPGLLTTSDRRILSAVGDGLGGVPGREGKTKLKSASTSNADATAQRSICRLSVPIAPANALRVK